MCIILIMIEFIKLIQNNQLVQFINTKTEFSPEHQHLKPFQDQQHSYFT